MTGYYDLVLGIIPLALVGSTLAVALTGLSVAVGVTIGSVVSIGVIVHAMFVNGPVDETGVEPAGTSEPTPTAGGVAPGGD